MLQQDDLLTQKVEVILDMNSKKVLAEFVKLHSELAELKADVAELKKRKSAPAPEAPAQQQYAQPMGPPQGYNPYAQQGYPQAGYPPQGYPQQAPPQQFARGGAPEPPPGWQPRGAEPQQQMTEEEAHRATLTKPIDRNGVAPADVDIAKMFYCGNKKK
jgi:hypothetical protein